MNGDSSERASNPELPRRPEWEPDKQHIRYFGRKDCPEGVLIHHDQAATAWWCYEEQRANYWEAEAQRLARENGELRHDIERHASDLSAEVEHSERLRAALRELAFHADLGAAPDFSDTQRELLAMAVKRAQTLVSDEPDSAVETASESRGYGFEQIVGVAVKGSRAVVYGNPAVLPLPEDHEAQHNCDRMGCGMTHVLWRGPIDKESAPKASVFPGWTCKCGNLNLVANLPCACGRLPPNAKEG